MPVQICIRCYITGKVQGVWFRANTQKEAEKLSITGWARNLPDGRVEVLACGNQEKVETLYRWLQHGPELAKVSHITREDLPLQSYHGFEVL